MLKQLRILFHDEAGGSGMEYMLVLAMVALGATTILGSAASFFSNLVQTLVNTASAAWPA